MSLKYETATQAPRKALAELVHPLPGKKEHEPETRIPNPETATPRECSSLATYWCRSTLSSKLFGGPASSHGGLDSLSQVALHLPFQGSYDVEVNPEARNFSPHLLLSSLELSDTKVHEP